MSQITDFIKQQVVAAASGNSAIPEELKDKIMGGVADSVFDSIKQTAQSSGGIEQLTSLFTGKTSAENSPITALAGKIFETDFAKKLGLSPAVTSAITTMLPIVIGKLTSKDGDGLDLDDLIKMFGGANASTDKSSFLKKAAGSLLGKLFKR